jgi:hypothetical protein
MLHFHCPNTEKPVATGVHVPDFAYFLEDDKDRAEHGEPPCIDAPLK